MSKFLNLSIITTLVLSSFTLEASPPTSGLTSTIDSDVASNVRNALQEDHSLSGSGRSVQVTVKDGVVTLTGVVLSARERRKVSRVARNVPGVKSVNNKLTTSFRQ